MGSGAATAGAAAREPRTPARRPMRRRAPLRRAARCRRRPSLPGRPARRPRARARPRGSAPARVGRRLALEEDASEQAPLAHHAAAVVAHHRVLQAGEDVLAREAVAERLGRDVGDEHRAGLAEVGRPVALRGQQPELGDVVDAVRDRLLLEERAGAGAAHAVHVGVHHAAALDVDELGVLPADLDDREAAAAVRVQPGGRHGVRDDLVLHREPPVERGIGGAEDGRGGVAPGAGDAHGDDRVGHHLAHLGDQRLCRLDRVALGAPVDAAEDDAGGEVEQRGLGAGGAEVEAEDGRRLWAGQRVALLFEPHDRARPLARRPEPRHAAARRAHELVWIRRERRGARKPAGRGRMGGREAV